MRSQNVTFVRGNPPGSTPMLYRAMRKFRFLLLLSLTCSRQQGVFFMNRLVSLFKKLQLGRLLTLLVVGVALFLTTACNPGNEVGARPRNLPVQMGGNNNPHTMGGDGYTNYRMSTDPAVNKNNGNSARNKADQPKRASVNIKFDQWLASSAIESNASDILYPGSNTFETEQPDIGPKKQAFQPEPIPAKRQAVIDRSNQNEKILEKVGQQFEDASNFLRDTANSADEHPELQVNPAVDR